MSDRHPLSAVQGLKPGYLGAEFVELGSKLGHLALVQVVGGGERVQVDLSIERRAHDPYFRERSAFVTEGEGGSPPVPALAREVPLAA